MYRLNCIWDDVSVRISQESRMVITMIAVAVAECVRVQPYLLPI